VGTFNGVDDPPDVCTRLDRGMAVWRTQINYLGAALAGDRVEVATGPSQ
jgi:hypothetical protein